MAKRKGPLPCPKCGSEPKIHISGKFTAASLGAYRCVQCTSDEEAADLVHYDHSGLAKNAWNQWVEANSGSLKTIKWSVRLDVQGCEIVEEFSLPASATKAEIDKEVREAALERVEWSWEVVSNRRD